MLSIMPLPATALVIGVALACMAYFALLTGGRIAMTEQPARVQ
jgi:hypothetical protein